MTDNLDFNKNMLSPVGLKFSLKRAPELNFFCQSVVLPGINMGSPDQPNPFKAIPQPGDHITYSELDLTFKINEDLTNYYQMFYWVQGLGFPEEFDQYKELASQDQMQGMGLKADGVIWVMSSAMNPIVSIEVDDMFPISLTPLTLDVRDTAIEYVEATVSFRFTHYKFTFK